MNLYTIGHSNHEFEKFVALLRANDISLIVDVRTSPFSRYNMSFNKDILESKLHKSKIEYFFAGKRLGGRPDDPTCYKNNKLPEKGADFLNLVDYGKIMTKAWFKKGVENLTNLAEKQVTAIMCSEEDPAKCHRHHLIAKFLFEEFPDIKITHIRGDGNVFSAHLITKTVDEELGVQLGLFGNDSK